VQADIGGEDLTAETRQVLNATLRNGLLRAWVELLSLEAVVQKTTEHFGGEEPIHPDAPCY